MDISIREQALLACRKLLSQLNRDPATPTYGCFDRRYWAWKLTDFPEATFQRNTAALAWYCQQDEGKGSPLLIEAIRAALLYACQIQHKNGSFDQAYPNERSYGAAAFLLPDLCSAYEAIAPHLTPEDGQMVRSRLRKTADFLCAGSEQHGLISNHLAGAALGLQKTAALFNEERYAEKSRAMVNHISAHQSDEGWYIEYGGADPGYQTLCMYYLAQVYKNEPNNELNASLSRSLDFLQYFVHPDGSFGGEYGSRRTEVYYPGGVALLANAFPVASAMHTHMQAAIRSGKTITLMDIDMGNNAPLLHNYIIAAESEGKPTSSQALPFEKDEVLTIFKQAGLGIRGNKRYYAVYSALNGGVFKVFSKGEGLCVYDDCGVLGETSGKQIISSQVAFPENEFAASEDSFSSKAAFSAVNAQSPTPFKYLLLRLANLTFMQFTVLNEWIKKLMVKVLISKKANLPLVRERNITFMDDSIHIHDRVHRTGNIRLTWLKQGIKFSAIHMASSRYYSPAQLHGQNALAFDSDELNKTGETEATIEIDIQSGTVTRSHD